MNTSKRLASCLSLLVTAASLGACSAPADDSGSTEIVSGHTSRTTDDIVGPALDAGPVAPLGEFACGPNLDCDGTTTYCQAYESGSGVIRPFPPPPPVVTYSCVPLPPTCANVAAPDCKNCIDPTPFGIQPALPQLRTCADVSGGSIVTVHNELVPLAATSP